MLRLGPRPPARSVYEHSRGPEVGPRHTPKPRAQDNETYNVASDVQKTFVKEWSLLHGGNAQS